MFRKFLRRIVGEEIKVALANKSEDDFAAAVNLHERSAANKHERFDGPAKHEVIGERTTGLVPNAEQRAAISDAAALIGRGNEVRSTGHPDKPGGRVTRRVIKREPIIVDPSNPSELLAAMRK